LGTWGDTGPLIADNRFNEDRVQRMQGAGWGIKGLLGGTMAGCGWG